jgi:hypothetical protein
MKHLSRRGIADLALLLLPAMTVGGCVFLADVGRTPDSHIVDDSGTGFNVAMAADSKKLHVSLDTEQTVEKRLIWAATFGTNQGPSASEFDAVASKWVKFEHPECKAGEGRRVSLGSYEYDLACSSEAPPE